MQATKTKTEDAAYSTAPERPTRQIWWRFLSSLALFGFMVGLMIGRITAPDEIRLLTITTQDSRRLQLQFDYEPWVQETYHEGTFSLLIYAKGEPQQGQLRQGDSLINWRLRPLGHPVLDPQLVLGFVSTRPLKGQWSGQDTEQGWQLSVQITPE